MRQGILKKFRVDTLCTTDDPVDSLEHHQRIASRSSGIRVLPGFRPDGALRTDDPVAFNAWVDKLAAVCNLDVSQLSHMLQALGKRHDDFHQLGCRLSDHGLDFCFSEPCTDREAEQVFDKVRGGNRPTPLESAKFASFLMLFFGRLDAGKGWTKQLHLGAYRNANTRMLKTSGATLDSMRSATGLRPPRSAVQLSRSTATRKTACRKMILYNLNPADN